jgi:hypothetical protein
LKDGIDPLPTSFPTTPKAPTSAVWASWKKTREENQIKDDPKKAAAEAVRPQPILEMGILRGPMTHP